MGELEKALGTRRDDGGRSFVPYVTGGVPGVNAELLRGLQRVGADAIEVGIPHSDPVMDGGVIQEASRRSLEAGTRPRDVLATIYQHLGVDPRHEFKDHSGRPTAVLGDGEPIRELT